MAAVEVLEWVTVVILVLSLVEILAWLTGEILEWLQLRYWSG